MSNTRIPAKQVRWSVRLATALLVALMVPAASLAQVKTTATATGSAKASLKTTKTTPKATKATKTTKTAGKTVPKGSAALGRSTDWQVGAKVTYRATSRVGKKAQPRTLAQLRVEREISGQRQATLNANLKTSVKAQGTYKKEVKVKKEAKKKITANLQVKTRARVAAEARLKAKITAQGKAKTQYDAAEKKLTASGSIKINISLGKKNAQKKERDTAKKKLDTANKEVEKAQKEVETATQAEEQVKEELVQVEEEVREVEEQIEEVEKEIEEIKEELKEVEEEIAEEEAQIEAIEAEEREDEDAIPEEDIVISEPPDEPPVNDFGYEEPVYGCFKGEVMFIETNSPSLPKDYSRYTVAAELYACEWDISERDFKMGFPGVHDQVEWFDIRYTGAFYVAVPGQYRFRVVSDDGAILTIDGQRVVDNDGQHATQSRSGEITLEAGNHELVLEYFQGPRYHIALQVFVTPPGEKEQIFTVR